MELEHVQREITQAWADIQSQQRKHKPHPSSPGYSPVAGTKRERRLTDTKRERALESGCTCPSALADTPYLCRKYSLLLLFVHQHKCLLVNHFTVWTLLFKASLQLHWAEMFYSGEKTICQNKLKPKFYTGQNYTTHTCNKVIINHKEFCSLSVR